MKIRAIATLLFILFSISAFGQGRAKISGYIRDADGNPLDLVNIRVKNTLNGTMSNEKGHYSLSVATGDSVTLIYSCLGYNKAETIRASLNKIGFDHEITVMFYTFASIINRLAFDTYFNCQSSIVNYQLISYLCTNF